MIGIKVEALSLFLAVTMSVAVPSLAQNAGQAELDKATELQLRAQSLSDLEQVAKHCEEALREGLDEGNTQFAEQLLSSTLFQHATQLCGPIFDQMTPDRRWPILRQFALRDLNRVVELDTKLGEAHLLIAKLQMLPGGNMVNAAKAVNEAIVLFEDEAKKRAEAFVVRAELREETKNKLEDYGKAIQDDPGNAEAWQGRALVYMEEGDFDKATADLNSLLAKDPQNFQSRLALAEALINMEKFDEALKHVDKAIELKPDSSLAYTLRARLHLIREDGEAAIADLDTAVKVNPQDLAALLIRATVNQSLDRLKEAKDDVEKVLALNPGLPRAILIRSMIHAAEGKLSDAISDMKLLLENDPKNEGYLLQLGGYYLQDDRHSKAIEVFTEILSNDETNTFALQARADTLLSIGKHAEAIDDFELLLKETPDDDSVLNNFAWVLATSPEDDLRDGKRAIELATRACEVTEYKKPHILSTLAAAYAETGDFKTAMKWSKKAVELSAEDEEDDVDDQLQQELDSYKQKKPWREKQTVEEKEEPIQPRRSSFEA